MGFRDEFLLTGKTYANWPLERTSATSLHANAVRLKALQNTVKSTFEEGVDRLAHVSASLRAEIAYQADRIEQAVLEGSGDVVDSIQRMSDYLGSELCEVRWAVERHTKVSEGILNVLLNSRDNESRQLFEEGVICYEANEYGLAKKTFLKALEAKTTNYFAYQYLGFIAVHEDKSEEAVRNFDLARKFAGTGYHQALALSHLARSHYAIGELYKAADLAKDATDFYPDKAKFWYECAAYCARIGNEERSRASLQEAIEKDWTYWSVVSVDTAFDSIRAGVNNLLDELRERERTKVRQALNGFKSAIITAGKVGAEDKLKECVEAYSSFEERYEEKNILIYRDLLPEIIKWHEQPLIIAEEFLKREKAKRLQQIDELKNSVILLQKEEAGIIVKHVGSWYLEVMMLVGLLIIIFFVSCIVLYFILSIIFFIGTALWEGVGLPTKGPNNIPHPLVESLAPIMAVIIAFSYVFYAWHEYRELSDARLKIRLRISERKQQIQPTLETLTKQLDNLNNHLDKCKIN